MKKVLFTLLIAVVIAVIYIQDANAPAPPMPWAQALNETTPAAGEAAAPLVLPKQGKWWDKIWPQRINR